MIAVLMRGNLFLLLIGVLYVGATIQAFYQGKFLFAVMMALWSMGDFVAAYL